MVPKTGGALNFLPGHISWTSLKHTKKKTYENYESQVTSGKMSTLKLHHMTLSLSRYNRERVILIGSK